MEQLKQPDGGRGRGVVRIYKHAPGTVAAAREALARGDRAGADALLAGGRLAVEQRNLIVSGSGGYGRNLICRALAGDETYGLGIDYGEIGTGVTAATDADTALETPAVRKAIEDAIVSNNVVTLRFFFTDAELPDDDYTEFGTFVGGSASIGTGQIFNRALFGTTYTKSTGEDTSVDVEITMSV